MVRITFLLEAFKNHSASNDTARGRVVYQLLWLKDQIEARRLPIPVDRSWVATLHYVVGSCEVDDTPEIAAVLGELSIIVKGIGLIKPRHVPVLISTFDDLIADIHQFADPLRPEEAVLVGLLEETLAGLATGELQPPLPLASRPGPLNAALIKQERLKYLFPQPPDPRHFAARRRPIAAPLYDSYRPDVARKPPMPAPVPGLNPIAPDFTIMRDLIATKITPARKD
jgi:hypothetical protein